jgi:hypothetical protein
MDDNREPADLTIAEVLTDLVLDKGGGVDLFTGSLTCSLRLVGCGELGEKPGAACYVAAGLAQAQRAGGVGLPRRICRNAGSFYLSVPSAELAWCSLNPDRCQRECSLIKRLQLGGIAAPVLFIF